MNSIVRGKKYSKKLIKIKDQLIKRYLKIEEIKVSIILIIVLIILYLISIRIIHFLINQIKLK
jgi:hypothetical protein